MKLSREQLCAVSKMEDDDFVESVIEELKSGDIPLKETETLKLRLHDALEYARSVGINAENLQRSLMIMEGYNPGFSSNPAIRKGIEASPDREQRYKDIMNGAMNISKRRGRG